MKVFLTFLALLMVFLSFFVFHTDRERMWALQDQLKSGAENGAAGAALFCDAASFGQGRGVINEEEAAQWVQWSMEQLESRLQLQAPGVLTYVYRQPAYGKAEIQVTYRLQKDLFRLPFLSVFQLTEGSVYEVKGYERIP